MPDQKRTAPHPEWVQMYRQGLTTTQIAATTGAAQSTVRYHLAIAAAADRPSVTTTAMPPALHGPRASLLRGCKTSATPSPCTRPKAGSPQPSHPPNASVPSPSG
jgi:hypothetical protein